MAAAVPSRQAALLCQTVAAELHAPPEQIRTTRDLITWLLRPFLDAPHSNNNNNGGSSSSDAQRQRLLLLLPPALQSARGVLRLHRAAPGVVPQLLEELAKLCVRAGDAGSQARRCVIHVAVAIAGDVMARDPALLTDVDRGNAVALAAVAAGILDCAPDAVAALRVAATLVLCGCAPVGGVVEAMRRRLPEALRVPDTWNPEVAAAVLHTLLDGLAAPLAAEAAEMAECAGASGSTGGWWSATAPWGASPRREGGPEPPQQQQQPTTAAPAPSSPSEYVIVNATQPQFHHPLPFPDRVPLPITAVNTTVLAALVLCSGALSPQAALALGHWTLQALAAFPSAIGAAALLQLLLKHPRGCRVSSAAPHVRFCDAVVIVACKSALVLFERAGVMDTGHGPEADEPAEPLTGAPVFFALCLQAVLVSRGCVLGRDAQVALGKAFVFVSRLFIARASVRATASSSSSSSSSGSVDGGAAVDIVDECLRCVYRAVDTALHDYPAGSPDTLRRVLTNAAPPHATLLARLEQNGAGLSHRDLLDTLLAAATADMAVASLVGVLPSSCETYSFGGFPVAGDSGLLARQKAWVLREASDALARQWAATYAGVHKSRTPQLDSFVRLAMRPL